MGVRDLTRLLQRFAPNAIKENRPHYYRGWPVAIDASLYLHRFVYAGHLQYAYPHVVGFYGLCRHLQAWKMRPIFVFDGEQRAESKQRESERRQRLKNQTERELYVSKARAERLERLAGLVADVNQLDTADRRAWFNRARNSWQEITGEAPSHPVMEYEATDTDQLSTSAQVALDHLQQLIRDAFDASKREQQQPSPSSPSSSGLITDTKEVSEKIHHHHRERAVATEVLPPTKNHKYLEAFEHRLLQGLPRSLLTIGDASNRDKLNQRIERITTDNHNTLVSLEKRAAYVTADFVADIKRLVELWGYLHITSGDYEAEAMCVSLAAAGISRATISEDTDAAAFGDYPLLRHFYVRDRPVFEINAGVARQILGMTRSQFIDMCILCGTDFSSTLEGIGPIRALKLIQKHTSIEEIIRAVGHKHPPRAGFDVEQARRVFTSLPPIPDQLFLPAGTTSGRIPVKEESPELMTFLEEFEVEVDTELTGNAYYEGTGADFEGIGPDPFSSSRSASSTSTTSQAALLNQLKFL
ncbi:PIN domain-like protein [Syncephalis plumigaleata]|nr:PIN domain-like protein [Syncephalis plumigaleata]